MKNVLISVFVVVPSLATGAAIADIGDATCMKAPPPLRPIASTHVIPPYPAISQRLGEQGSSVLRLTINPDGTVDTVTIFASSGYSRLDEAAAAYVRANWRWEPLSQNCGSGPVGTTVVVRWNLRGQTPNPFSDPAMLMKLVTFLPMDAADYPEDARAEGAKGLVLLFVLLSDQGEVLQAAVMHGSGSASLDAKSQEIVKTRYRWLAGRLNSKPIGSVVILGLYWLPPGSAVPTPDQFKTILQMMAPPAPPSPALPPPQ